ncbi:ArsR family transcriptional regulator [Escherichia coli]
MSDFITEDQRLVILRSLADYNGELGESVLQDCLDDYGHRVSRDTVHTHIAWLAEQGLVRKRVLINGYFIAELTCRGQDVAEGRACVPGVKKPRARG